ncbi:MAG: hypothetical protein JWN84_3167 [Nocardioides sp.]|nr:hypothetical protein [Nocardioides sp.]
MLHRLGLVSSSALVLVLALTGTASAARWSGPDPVGDARTLAFSADPPPCGSLVEGTSSTGDIRRLAVRHTTADVVVTLDVAGLARLDEPLVGLHLRTDRRDYDVDVTLRPGRPARAQLMTAISYGEASEPDECGQQYYMGWAHGLSCRVSARLDRGAGRVVVTVPRTCLKSPRWVRAGAEVQGDLGEGVVVLDEWARPDRADDSFLTPAFGARVHVGPRP